MKNQHGSTPLLIILILVMATTAGFIAWQAFSPKGDQTKVAPSSGASQSQTDPNAGFVVIKEWNVRFKPVEGFTGVQYFKPANVTSDSISITAERLATAEPDCSKTSGSMVHGLLTRSKSPEAEYGGVFATINGYSYQYRVSGAACSKNAANTPLEEQTTRQVMDSIKSLEAAK